MTSFFTYIARCSDGSLYTGYTSNVTEREKKHNLGKGAKYTASRRPIEIVYSEKYDTKSDAMRREREIKRWRKVEKEKLCSEYTDRK